MWKWKIFFRHNNLITNVSVEYFYYIIFIMRCFNVRSIVYEPYCPFLSWFVIQSCYGETDDKLFTFLLPYLWPVVRIFWLSLFSIFSQGRVRNIPLSEANFFTTNPSRSTMNVLYCYSFFIYILLLLQTINTPTFRYARQITSHDGCKKLHACFLHDKTQNTRFVINV